MSLADFLKNYYVKALITGIIALIGVCGGVYIGYAFIGEAQTTEQQVENQHKDIHERPMNISVGDLFPLETCTLPNGTVTNLEDILSGKKTLMIIGSVGCEPCTEFLEYFKTVESNIKDDVQLVACLSDHNPQLTEEYKYLLESFTSFFINADLFADTYNIVVYPTLVGIDKHGFIKHIQYVPTDWLEDEIVEEFTNM